MGRSSILINDKPVVINTKLAVVLGLSESIVLQQMNYWLQKSKHIIEGKRWIYNTYSNWQEQLPFFCESTIRRIIKRLEGMDIVLSANFNKSKMDKTKWYSINYDALNKLQEEPIKDSNINDSGNNDLDNASSLCCDNNEHMESTTDEWNCSNLAVDKINLNKPIPEITPETEDEKEKDFSDILEFFNSNIHPVTPHEHEKLKLLHEEIKNTDLILKAMELAVENRARSFRYIEVVLYNWMDLKLHTLQEVEEYIKSNNGGEKGCAALNDSREGKGNHGENKYSKWGRRQHSGNYKKAQGEDQGKYAGFKPEHTEVPDFTDEELEDFI